MQRTVSRWLRLKKLLVIAGLALPATLQGCLPVGRTVFSARTSPDGTRVIESGYDGDGAEGGWIELRGPRGTAGRFDFAETVPGAFMRWLDDSTVEVWQQDEPPLSPAPTGPVRLGDVRVVNRSYAAPRDQAAAFARTDVPVDRIEVPPEKVLATFIRRQQGNLRHCVLTLATVPAATYPPASVEIDAGVNPACGKPRPCSSIESRFRLGNGERIGRQTMVTQAIVSDIPSYNRLPEGGDGTSLRGQMLETSATGLVDALRTQSITLEFSIDFFARIAKYTLPLADARSSTEPFRTCVADADMSWLRH